MASVRIQLRPNGVVLCGAMSRNILRVDSYARGGETVLTDEPERWRLRRVIGRRPASYVRRWRKQACSRAGGDK